MVNMICSNKKCNHEWDYTGKATQWCTCPKCRWKVSMKNDNNFSNNVEESKEEAMPLQNSDGINPISNSPNKFIDENANFPSSTTQQETKSGGEDASVVDSDTKSNNSGDDDSPELLIKEEPQVSTNPNDYDWRCSVCAELFNTEGNIYNNKIKCPDCGLELPYDGTN